MNESQQVLSQITVYDKYAKFIPKLKRRETWTEIIDRYISMMIKQYPQVKDEILQSVGYLYDKKILPSMRCLQFSGPAIEKNHTRGYNCAYMPMDDYRGFSELMFLLLGGTGK